MKQVLIVDDEARLLKSIEAGLASYHDQFAVLTASNGNEALCILQKEKIDLLVTDLRMPEMDGFELLAHIAIAHSFMPSIVMTAFATPEIEERVNSTGMSKLLEKPIDLGRLASAVLEGLSQEGKEGSVAGFSLGNFLQLLAMEQKTCLLKVQEGTRDGYIYLVDGEIHAATTGNLKGEEALFVLLDCDNLRITFKKTPQKQIPRTIRKPLMSLLMEGMQRKDEILYELEKQQVPAGIFAVPEQYFSETSNSHYRETASVHPEDQRKATTGNSAKGEINMSKLDDTLGKLKDIEGFMAVGVFTPNGEMAAQVNISNLKLAEIGSLANDVLLKAQKATDIMNVGRGQVVHIDAPQAHIIARCLNEAENFSQTQAGKAHIHIILILGKEGNLAMAKIKMESLLPEISSAFR
jgi:CheY-like chemotaxis protein